MAGITGFFHGGITVKDMEASLAFYRDGLGLAIKLDRILDGPYLNVVLGMSQKQIRGVYFDIPGGGYLELLEYQDIERFDAAARPWRRRAARPRAHDELRRAPRAGHARVVGL